MIDVVVAARLEEEVTGLPRRHRDQPADQRRHHGVEEQHHIGEQEARRADEVQRLIDAAVVIITMVVPALGSQFLQEILDHSLPPNSFGLVFTGIRCPACDIMMLTCDWTRGDAVTQQQPLRVRPPRRRRLYENAPGRNGRAAAPVGVPPVPCRAHRPAIAHNATRRTRRCGSRVGAPPAAAAAR